VTQYAQLSWSGDSALARLSSKSFEWYTPPRYVEAARALMGAIDLDPASCSFANQVVKATIYYDIRSNGLDKPWAAKSLWLNPPYGRGDGNKSNQEIWTCRLIAQYEAGITSEAVLLVNAATETEWFRRLGVYPLCFIDHRINFYTQSSRVSGPTHASAIAYFGPQWEQFEELFGQFGHVVYPRSVQAPATLWDGGAA
jgi:ParB family chromosome partitioning protein